MPEMLSIGRFGALTGLTARALRLYDQLDLLRPAMVDFPSGYRYYSPEQADIARNRTASSGADAFAGDRGATPD